MAVFDVMFQPVIGSSLLVCVLVGAAMQLMGRRLSSLIQKVGYDVKDPAKRKAQYTAAASELLGTGYKQFKDTIFGVDTLDGMKLVLPARFISEVVSNNSLSFFDSLSHDTLLDYTYMGGVEDEPLNLFKKAVTPHLAKFVPQFIELIQENLNAELGELKDWTSKPMYPKMLRTIAVLTARVLVGGQAPYNPVWISLTEEYVLAAISYAHSLRRWPEFLRPIVYRWLPEYPKVEKQLSDAREIILQAFAEQDMKKASGESPENPLPLLYHLGLDPKDRKGRRLEQQIQWQLNLAVGGIHTTSSTLTQCVFELGVHHDIVTTLRAEVKEIYDEQHGTFDKGGLARMRKLDSFMREVQRLHSPNLTTIQRRSKNAVTLSDGTYIPKGTKLEFPTFAIHRDESNYYRATEFDPWRFLKLSKDGASGKHNYVSTNNEFLGWGVGRTACPGRFLADVEIKLILAHLLLHYDMKNPKGQPRYPSVYFENQVFANGSGELLLKSI